MLHRYLVALATLLFISTSASAQLVGVTFLNNSPDPALAKADIYVIQNGAPQKGEDVAYQEADNLQSMFIFGDLVTTIKVAPGSSAGEGDAVAEYTFTPAPNAAYMIIISGVATPGDFAANPDGKDIGYAITVFETPFFEGNPTDIGTLFFHGSTDQESSDLRVRGRDNPVLGDAAYGDYTAENVNLPREAAIFDLTAPGKKADVYGSFEVNLASYSSEVVVLVLSGFKTPDDNNSEQSLVLLAVLENGGVVRNELISGSQTASIQIIHNAADPAATIVDLWVNGQKALENLGFRKASPFIELPAGEPVVVGFAPATSKDYSDTIKTVTIPALRPGRSYHFIAQGILDTASFVANPDNRAIELTVHVAEGARAASETDGKTEVRIVHGATDAGELIIRSQLGVEYTSGMRYSDITPTYLAVEPSTDTLWVIDPETDKPVKGWIANLSGNKRATVLLASGFLSPEDNQNGERFRLILVDANGNVNANLQEVDPEPVSVTEDPFSTAQFSVYPNPTADAFSLTLDPTHAAGVVSALLYAANGTQVASFAFQAENGVTIPTDGLADGLYLVRLTTGTGLPLGTSTVVVRR